jgi:hypothetical protein
MTYNSPSLHIGEFSIAYRSVNVRRFSNFLSQATENWSSPSLRSGESLNFLSQAHAMMCVQVHDKNIESTLYSIIFVINIFQNA